MSRKNLSEMSLEELWQLFPIILSPPKRCWSKWYHEEEMRLRELLPAAQRFHHIGSTAVPGIWAKPIIDILVEMADKAALQEAKQILSQSGYLVMSAENERAALNKGYTPDGFADRVFHIHLRLPGDTDEVRFRNFLRSHPDAARKYEQLKRKLWPLYEHDRDGYTAAKSDFVAQCMAQALTDC